MATTTTNLGLVLPVGTENVSRQIINDNNSIIDSAIGEVPSGKSLQDEIDDIEEALGDMIDDTAGDGDTDKVWSADKVTDELELKAPKASPDFTGSLSLKRKANTTKATGSTAFGYDVTASASYSHGEGLATNATGNQSHAEGKWTTAAGQQSHAEGYMTNANGESSHAEGQSSVTGISASAAHAEGNQTSASGANSHSEGYNTTASGTNAHAEGYSTMANHKSQHVFGEYNVHDPSEEQSTARGNYVEIVGNGTGTNARSNARTLDWSGNERIAGDLYVGCNADSSGGTKVAKVTDITAAMSVVSTGEGVYTLVLGS